MAKPPATAAAARSLYPTETLGALDDEGAITTKDETLARLMRDLCGHND